MVARVGIQLWKKMTHQTIFFPFQKANKNSENLNKKKTYVAWEDNAMEYSNDDEEEKTNKIN